MAKKKTTKKKTTTDKPMTKSEVYKAVADKTGLTRKQVVEVFDATTEIMVKEVKKKGSFNFIGLMKMILVKKPAVRGGKMVRNPFTGEMVKQKPKPASKTVKVRPMKALKDQL
jgi:nucleoid DNA-binding protein